MAVAAERWSIDARTPRALDDWADVLAATHLAFDVRATPRTPNRFRGAVSRRRFGGLTLVDCESQPWLGHRARDLMGADSEAVIGFQTMRKGVERVRENRRAVDLTAGDVVLWDGAVPVDVEVVEPFFKRTLIFPRDRVLSVVPRLAEVGAMPSLTRSAPARLLARYLDALALELPSLDHAARGAAADAALELLRAAVEPGVPTARSAKRDALRAHVRRFVRANLQDPALGPESIARSQSISVRSLHALFEDAADSVAGLVRRERLARCLADLELSSGGSVTEIAFRWGFRDAAHFSRAFKRAFDVTPSEVRRAAVEREAQWRA